MPRPLLSVVVPTIGREPGLAQALSSVVEQPGAPAIDIVVVGDSHGGRDLRDARLTAKSYGARWFEHDGGFSCFGQPQRQFGMAKARGEWLAFLADDDIWQPLAFQRIQRAIDGLREPCPVMFRVEHWIGWPIWDRAAVMPGHVDANCIVVPNDPRKLGRWGSRYEGDYDFIRETVEAYGGEVVWSTAVIGICRPAPEEVWMHRDPASAELIL